MCNVLNRFGDAYKKDVSSMIPVSSSNIAGVLYNEQQRTLQVKFTNDTIYVYSGVPAEVYRALMGSPSKGKFFADMIKRHYQFTKLS